MSDFFKQTLASKTNQLLDKLSSQKWLDKFYLAGGTALALQLGHRQSVDLDWFLVNDFKTKEIINKLSKFGKFELVNEEENTIEGWLDGVKLSFMTYPYPLLKEKIKYNQQVFLADQLDIAIMKLGAIAGRNNKKDFIDLYIYLLNDKKDLNYLFRQMDNKFRGFKYDHYHILKSLVYFVEANSDPDPKMLIDFDWEKTKKFFRAGVKKLE